VATYYWELTASRIANATRVDQSGADDGDVIDWDKSADFILATLFETNKGPLSRAIKLQWRDTDGGSFADVASTGEISFSADTDLVDGDDVLVGERLCDAGTGAWQNGLESEGDNILPDSGTYELADDYYTETQWALDCSGAQDGHQYEFQIYDITIGIVRDLCLAQITMAAAAEGTLQQSHFRVRTADAVGLNVDSGWAAALDTDPTIDAETLFRIRFELEELDSNSKTATLKFQYRKGAGGWVDLTYQPRTALATAAPSVYITDSAQYVDAAATTNVLAASAKTFTAGTGEENNTLPELTMNNQHTEYEVCVVIHTFYDGPGQNVDADTFEFRMVESDDTILGGTYVTPQITLNVPAGLIGGCFVESPARIGPFLDTNGNLYAIIEPAETENVMIVIKSTTGGDDWAEVDGANRPTNTDLESVDVQQVGDTLHILHQRGSLYSHAVLYHRFRMSDHATNPDTWEITDEAITSTISTSNQCAAIAVRSDTTIVAFYNSGDGTDDRVYYKIRSSGGVWGSENSLDNTATTAFLFASCVLGASDKVHIFYHEQDNHDIYHKSLNSSDTLSARELVEADASSGATLRWGMTEAIYWDDSGDEIIMVAVRDESDKFLYTIVVTNDGSPETRKLATAAVAEKDQDSEQPTATLAIDAATKTAYILYSGNVDYDLWRDKAVNDGGWGTDVELLADKTIHWVRARVFTHSAGNGGKKVLGYLYDNGSDGGTGFIWYKEYELGIVKALEGAFTCSATLTKKAKKPLAGSLSFAGAVTKKATKTLAGSLTMAGVLKNKAKKVLTGALSSSGALQSKAKKALAGALSTSGTLKSKAKKSLTGSFTPAGTVTKKTTKSLAGALTMAGTVDAIKKIIKVLEGAITFTGTLTAKAKKVLAGSITPTGAVTKKPKITLAGTLTMAGAVIGIKKIVKILEGAITFSGDLKAKAKKVLAGTLTSTGAVAKKTTKTLAGTFTSSGVVTAIKKFYKTLEGAITFSGDLAAKAKKVLVGSITPVGAVTKKPTKTLAGALTMAGALTAKARKALAGALTPVGAVTKKTTKSLAGSLTLIGTVVKKTTKTLAGALTMAGDLFAELAGGELFYKTIEGAITFTGTLTKKPKKVLSGTFTMIGTLAARIRGTAGLEIRAALNKARVWAGSLFTSEIRASDVEPPDIKGAKKL
jgi:hypothetical protein